MDQCCIGAEVYNVQVCDEAVSEAQIAPNVLRQTR